MSSSSKRDSLKRCADDSHDTEDQRLDSMPLSAPTSLPTSEVAAMSSTSSFSLHNPPTLRANKYQKIRSKHSTDILALDIPIADVVEPPGSTDIPSRFMALPRELRDEIYDYLNHTIRSKSTLPEAGPSIQGIVFYGPRAALLRISKQFSAEYENRIRKKAILRIHDSTREPLAQDTDFPLLSSFKYIRHAEFQIVGMIANGHAAALREVEATTCLWLGKFRSLSSDALRVRADIIVWALDETSYDRKALRALLESSKTGEAKCAPSENKRLFGRLITCQNMEQLSFRCLAGGPGLSPSTPTVYGSWTVKRGWRSHKRKKVQGKPLVEG